MLLSITTTHSPATDLGYLLHKHPNRRQEFELAFGRAHVFYPEATAERCTAALLLEVDPIGMVRGRGKSRSSGPLSQYVNDRPYVASSFLSVAIAHVFGTALQGRCNQRPELVGTSMPLRAHLPALPCRGGDAFLRSLFEPLGYDVSTTPHPLDPNFPDWGESPYYTVDIERETTLRDLLTHLYVLVPVLDNFKHYFVSEAEVENLLSKGEGWLSEHPQREAIVKRYLKHQRGLSREALARLTEGDEPNEDEAEPAKSAEVGLEKAMSLNEQRLGSVVAALKACRAKRVLDLGCGEGRLLRQLIKDPSFEEIVGVDVSIRALEIAHKRLKLDRLPEQQKSRIRLMHGSLMYRDKRLHSFDAAAVVEVIEHLDPPRLAAFERMLFEFARPGSVTLTTPNREYNVLWEGIGPDRLRHRDHRFEWTREEFHNWADGVAERFAYGVRYLPVGPEDEQAGPPTQMAIFTRSETV